MRVASLVLIVFAGITLAAQSALTSSEEHSQWVAASLSEMQSIKVGMGRSELEKVFETEGGLAVRLHGTYVYRRCRYFKVDVDFAPAESGNTKEDRIVKISRPYLAWTVGD